MREGKSPWGRIFTSTARLWKNTADAVFHGRAVPCSLPAWHQSPVKSAEAEFLPVRTPDAVAELSRASGNDELDRIHEILIDCLQAGHINAIRIPGKEDLRFYPTETGRAYIKHVLGEYK